MFMGLNAVQRVMEDMQWDDFSKLSEVVNPVVLLKLSKHSAFHAIANGCRVQNAENPFENADHLADTIESFDELRPAVDLFTEACKGFFAKKGATKTATLPKAGRQTRSR